jgi:hypothetical protein
VAAVDKAVRFRKQLVLDAHGGHVTLLELSHQAPHVVEVAVAGVAVEHDRDGRGLGHELDHLEDLGPARLIAVPDAELGGQGQTAGPESAESRFLADPGADAVVRLQQELGFAGFKERAEARRPGYGFGVVGRFGRAARCHLSLRWRRMSFA